MKLLCLLLTFSVLSVTYAQISEGLGIYEIDDCDFETDCDRVSIDTAETNIWQIGSPDKMVFDNAHSPINCMVTDTALTYPVSNHSAFEYTAYEEGGGMAFNYLLEFRHRYDSDTLRDGGFIEFRYDPEGIWRNVIDHQDLYPEFEFYSENLYSETDTLVGGENGFSGFSEEWIYTRLQWIYYYPIRESYDTLYLRFNFISDDIDTERDGWMIDDFSLSTVNFGGDLAEVNGKSAYINVFPNPANDQITVSFDDHHNDAYVISVLNLIGQKSAIIEEVSGTENILNTNDLPNGIYEIQIHMDGIVVAREKLVVQH